MRLVSRDHCRKFDDLLEAFFEFFPDSSVQILLQVKLEIDLYLSMLRRVDRGTTVPPLQIPPGRQSSELHQ